MYHFFSFFCHQITQRSLCVYETSIADCYNQNTKYENNTKEIRVNNLIGKGIKFPVCSRDTAFFFSMLIGGIIIWIFNKNYNNPLPLWLFILIILPLAIDGLTQIIGLRESTNTIRIITGFIAGFGMPFFIIGLLNKSKKTESNKKIKVKRKNKKERGN